MVIRRLIGDWAAHLIVVLLIAGLFLAIVVSSGSAQAIDIHAVMPEKGGWIPDNLTAEVDVPLNLRLTSDDVMHGFAVGQQPWPAVDVEPGQVTQLTLTFDEPGTYTFYCTRWCGPNHWRMRGTIEVTDGANGPAVAEFDQQPLYARLGLDIDAPHDVDARLDRTPSATRGEVLDITVSPQFRTRDAYIEQTPFELWQELRAEPGAGNLSSADIWDLVAFIWRSHATSESLRLGQSLYAENCSACHGENGDGNGVMALSKTAKNDSESFGQTLLAPIDFTDSQQMLGANSALLQGKIIRGGMGTGMPYWGTIFTDDEINALIDYLWTFQFPITAAE
jgi:plastocyanin/cytochrome c5